MTPFDEDKESFAVDERGVEPSKGKENPIEKGVEALLTAVKNLTESQTKLTQDMAEVKTGLNDTRKDLDEVKTGLNDTRKDFDEVRIGMLGLQQQVNGINSSLHTVMSRVNAIEANSWAEMSDTNLLGQMNLRKEEPSYVVNDIGGRSHAIFEGTKNGRRLPVNNPD